MAKKKLKSNGHDNDPLAIPEFLLVKNRKPQTPEQIAKFQAGLVQRTEEAKQNYRLPRNIEPAGLAILEALENKRAASATKPSPAPRPDKPARPSREGLTSIATLAAEHQLLPREARARLRAAKYAKPPQGWAFAAAELDAVRAILKAPAPAKTPRAGKQSAPTPRARKGRRQKMRVSKRAVASGALGFSGKGKEYNKANRKPGPAPAVTNIFEAKHAQRIKEIAPCPSPRNVTGSKKSLSPNKRKPRSGKTSKKPARSSTTRSNVRSRSSKKTTTTKAMTKKSTKR